MKRTAWMSGLLVIALTATGFGDGGDGGGGSAAPPVKITFSSNRDGNFEVYAMNADGTNQVRLTNNAADDSRPAFSPDGSKIAFASDRDGNWEVYAMDADGTNPVNLTNNAADDYQPSFSRDGTKIKREK